jgi:hypothetical protein
MGSKWDHIDPKYIALATEPMGMIYGFTTPPQFHGPGGKWSATGKGHKAALYLAPNAPGDNAGNTAEYRPGHDPGPGKRPMPITKNSIPKDSLTVANQEVMKQHGIAPPVEGQPPTPYVVGAAPRNSAPPSTPPPAPAAPAATAAPFDHTVRPIAQELSTLADGGEVREAPRTPLTIIESSATVSGTAAPAASLTMPGIIYPATNAPWPEYPYIGDPLPMPSPNTWPTQPPINTPGLVPGTLDWRHCIQTPVVTRKEVDELKAKIEHLITIVLQLVPRKPIGKELRAAIAALTPPPVLTDLEKVAHSKLADLVRDAGAMRGQGYTAKEIEAVQVAAVKFWTEVNASREAKLAQGAKP